MISWLSGFLFNPWMALGSGAVASPILIHILSRRRFKRVRWAAMDFLIDAHRKNRKRVRMEQLILLALRCLIILLLALAFARPFLSSGGLAGLFGGSQTEHIVVLDDSFSMSATSRGAASTGASRANFDHGKDAVDSIARLVADASPADALTLYVASRPDEPILSLPNVSDSNRVRLTEALAAVSVTQHAGAFGESMRSIAGQIAESPTRANTVVYVVSDFQRRDWNASPSAADSTARTGPLAPLAALDNQQNAIRCVLVGVGGSNTGNVAVAMIQAERPLAIAGVPTRFIVGVANHSTEVLRDVELGVAIDGRRLPPVVIREIMPDEIVREPVEVTFDQDGANFLEVEVVGAASSVDTLALDNKRAASVDVAAAVRVLIVDGEPSTDQYRDETFLLKTALRPMGRATSGVEVTVVEEGEAEEFELDDYQVVILANLGRVTRTVNERLRSFVDSGGGLVVFAGDLVDVADYNESLYQDGDGLLPLSIVGPAEAPPGTGALSIDAWNAAHPMLRSFSGPAAELLRQVRIDAYLQLAGVDDNDEDTSNATSDEYASSSPIVIARLNDAFRSPFIVEKTVGRGRTIFIASSADQEWNDWASNFSYLPFVLEMVQYIARPLSDQRDVVVGEKLACAIDRSVVEPTVGLRTPTYPTEPEFKLEPAGNTPGSNANDNGSGVTQADSSVVVFGDTQRAGRYQFIMKRLRGGKLARFAVVNPDAGESNLAVASMNELTAGAGALDVEFIDEPAAIAAAADKGRSEFWWPILLLVAAVMMIEHGLAWKFGSSV